MNDETYGPEWTHCTIHRNSKTGTLHSDGDHQIRIDFERALEDARRLRTIRALLAQDTTVLAPASPAVDFEDLASRLTSTVKGDIP